VLRRVRGGRGEKCGKLVLKICWWARAVKFERAAAGPTAKLVDPQQPLVQVFARPPLTRTTDFPAEPEIATKRMALAKPSTASHKINYKIDGERINQSRLGANMEVNQRTLSIYDTVFYYYVCRISTSFLFCCCLLRASSCEVPQ
jgi:hypothetical protein